MKSAWRESCLCKPRFLLHHKERVAVVPIQKLCKIKGLRYKVLHPAYINIFLPGGPKTYAIAINAINGDQGKQLEGILGSRVAVVSEPAHLDGLSAITERDGYISCSEDMLHSKRRQNAFRLVGVGTMGSKTD